jgi:hypothetical protein
VTGVFKNKFCDYIGFTLKKKKKSLPDLLIPRTHIFSTDSGFTHLYLLHSFQGLKRLTLFIKKAERRISSLYESNKQKIL